MRPANALLARVAAAAVERARAEAAMAERFAPDFNAVALLAPGETRLSEAFRWLLDETETHGQGGLFRDHFVTDLLGDGREVWVGARVTCEVATVDGGRIDLLMESRDGARCVVIENKPWAGWQVNQLSRYRDDQVARGRDVRVHALIGDVDATGTLERHWKKGGLEALPPTVTASGFGKVTAWLEACAATTRADKVRSFLFDLADYCRRSILSEPSMTEIDDTADLILAGGEEALRAAQAIAAAVPLAMTRDVARRVGGFPELVGSHPSVRVTVEGVPLNFVLFGHHALWAGVTDKDWTTRLDGNVDWGPPERHWPKWAYLRKAGEHGPALARAAASGDLDTVARLVPDVARALIGSQPTS